MQVKVDEVSIKRCGKDQSAKKDEIKREKT